MIARISPVILRTAVLSVAVALGAATVGADLVDVVTCGAETAEDCASAPGRDGHDEGACDHCPSCMIAHGHMQSLVAGVPIQAPVPGTSGLASVRQNLRPHVSEQHIFHPPITPSV